MTRRKCKEDEEEEEVPTCQNNSVKTIENEIYFYEDVCNESILELTDQFKTLEKKLLKLSVDLEGYVPTIKIFINSNGGDVYAGLAGMDMLRNSKIHVQTIATGCCASAATFLLLGGDLRKMTKNSKILIHQLSTGFWGKFEELKDEMKTSEKLMENIKNNYKLNTKIPEKKLNKLMTRDIYMNIEECIKFKIVDAAC